MSADHIDAELLSGLLALFAHDLRNPLAALQSNLVYVEQGADVLPGDLRDALADCHASVDGLAHLVDNLAELSSTLSGRERAPNVRVSLDALLLEAVESCRRAAASHEVTIETDASPLRDVWVHSRRELALLAVVNLLRNAAQWTPRAVPVRVRLVAHGGAPGIEVEDGGPVIGAALASAAFTARGQLEGKSVAEARYSRGLGLFVARTAAQGAGASVTADVSADGLSVLRITWAPAASS